MFRSLSSYARFAWLSLGYTVLVIIWGGFVRATGSGAGCGDHWPLCNGEVVPRSPSAETFIEYSHRLTSGVALILVVILYIWARRRFEKGSLTRKAAGASLFFMVTEALIGAGLVLFQYVAYDVSIARAYWMTAHLVNTFILLAAMTMTAYWASGGAAIRIRGQGARATSLFAALIGTLILGASGAITALGDTLVIGGGISPAENAVVETLVGLRVYHPIIACFILIAVAWAAWVAQERPTNLTARRLGNAVLGLFLFQMVVGVVNVLLMAPVWIQMLHLLITDAIWIGLVLFATTSLSTRPDPVAEATPNTAQPTRAEVVGV